MEIIRATGLKGKYIGEVKVVEGEEMVIAGKKVFLIATRYDCNHYHPAGHNVEHEVLCALVQEEERERIRKLNFEELKDWETLCGERMKAEATYVEEKGWGLRFTY